MTLRFTPHAFRFYAACFVIALLVWVAHIGQPEPAQAQNGPPTALLFKIGDSGYGLVSSQGEILFSPLVRDLRWNTMCREDGKVVNEHALLLWWRMNEDKKSAFTESTQSLATNQNASTQLTEKLMFVDISGQWIIQSGVDGNKWELKRRFQETRPFPQGIDLARAKEENQWGFIDQQGQWEIQPQFKNVKDFSVKGLAPAADDVDGNLRWGIINRQGEWVIKPCFAASVHAIDADGIAYTEDNGIFDIGQRQWILDPDLGIAEHVGRFDANGLAPAMTGRRKGFVDRQGNWKIEPHFQNVGLFDGTSNLAPAKARSKWGFIDRMGKWAIRPDFQEVGRFDGQRNVARARENGKWGFINRKGQWVVEPRFEELMDFDSKNGLAPAREEKKWGFIDRKGNWVIEPRFQEAKQFDAICNLAPAIALKDYKWGFINRKGQWVVEPRFLMVGDFDKHTGLAQAQEGSDQEKGAYGKFGFIDRKGNWVVTPRFRWIDTIDKKRVATVQGNYDFWGRYDLRRNQWIVEPILYGKEYLACLDQNGLAPAMRIDDDAINLPLYQRKTTVGFVNHKGDWKISPRFAVARCFETQTGLAPARQKDEEGGKWGFIDKKGNWVIQPHFDNAETFDSATGWAQVQQKDEEGGKWGFIDKKGNWMIPPQFDDLNKFNTSAGLAIARNNKKITVFDDSEGMTKTESLSQWGVIDRKGNWVVTPRFGPFSEIEIDGRGKVWVVQSHQPDRFDIQRQQWVSDKKRLRYVDALFDKKGFAPVENDNTFGFLNRQGQWAIAPVFDAVRDFDTQGLALVKMWRAWGAIDVRGKWIFEPVFATVGDFDPQTGWAVASREDGKWGFIDRKGNWIIEPRFSGLGSFSGQIWAPAEQNGKWGFIDRTGNWVIKPRFSGLGSFGGQIWAPAEQDGKWGFIDRTGNWVIKPQFEEVKKFYAIPGATPSKKDGKWGFIDQDGQWIIEPRFEKIRDHREVTGGMTQVLYQPEPNLFRGCVRMSPWELRSTWGWVNPEGRKVPNFDTVCGQTVIRDMDGRHIIWPRNLDEHTCKITR